MFLLPELEYEIYALHPFISPYLLYLHYYKHHQKYIDKLNELIATDRQYTGKNILEIIFIANKNRHTKILNNACQHYNHSFFWKSLSPTLQQIPKELEENLLAIFSTKTNFINTLQTVAKSLFGSGYLYIVVNTKFKTKTNSHNHYLSIEIITTKDADVPQLYGHYLPICTLDLWEHAYYIDYLFQRDKYIEQFYNYINWSFVFDNYKKIKNDMYRK